MPTEIAPPMKAKGVVHKMIADIAKGCARDQWETLAKQNAFYKAYGKPGPYVRKFWPKYLPVARAILVGMLGMDAYTQAQKDEIYEVLLKDGAVNPKTMAEPAKPVITFSR